MHRTFDISAPTPLAAEFELIDAIVLDQREGWALVDEALEIVDVERLGVTALVEEILDELPPELDDG